MSNKNFVYHFTGHCLAAASIKDSDDDDSNANISGVVMMALATARAHSVYAITAHLAPDG